MSDQVLSPAPETPCANLVSVANHFSNPFHRNLAVVDSSTESIEALSSPLSRTALIPLTQGKIAFVDVWDLPILTRYRWTAIRSGETWYAKTRIDGKTVYMHRFLLFAERATREKHKVDHVNRNGLDNRRENLRPVTHSQNMMNSTGRRATRKSSFKGVSVRMHHSKPFRANIGVEGRQRHLGYFTSEEGAARAYDQAALHYFGPHARLNFPGESHDQHSIPAARTRSLVALIPPPGPTASYAALTN